ncbi:hypothetical protein Scep_002143 [Stephania cephalantha]|uniref:Uncharacterized protein n=1 Tax=Stephania cephalantha TaxID=152367 RepID=A0AAP0LAW0_9MAGN
MEVANRMYFFFNPRMRNHRSLASLIFSSTSSSKISAQMLLTCKKYSEIDISPCVEDANSFSKNCNFAIFFLENGLSSVSHTLLLVS